MIAASVGYDLVFLVHVIAAVATVVVLAGLRITAASVNERMDRSRAELRSRFPDRVDWAARVIHLLPITGVILAIVGSKDVGFAQAWVGAGMALYVGAAFWLEARALPAERELARAIQSNGEVATTLAPTFVRQLDGVLLIIALAVVTMIVQF